MKNSVLRSLLVLLIVSVCSSLPAQELETSPPAPQPESGVERPLPTVFRKAAPASLADLKAIEKHVIELVPRLKASTVNLKIGRAQGSGVIVNSAGYILTAAHVSGEPGRDVTIITSTGKRYSGTTLGRNRILDASMVRINSNRKDWPYSPMSVVLPDPGDWCAVMGHPGGYQSDRGVVLRLGRVIRLNSWMIQTDCELVGGDSGGPLFNMRGEVIGINTRIGESTEFNLHVPVAVYHRDWKRLVASEDFRTHSGAYLGVTGTPVESGDGLRIDKVFPGDPADRAGLQTGDILLKFQGTEIHTLDQLSELIGEEFPGRSVDLQLLRDGETVVKKVRLGMRWD